ncbi:MAG: hypothetical protein EA360_03730 [Balneolaceae bacterium]|nr:MAG: hypothetical protein EA360_03730 [Balneolaceae bacterium]
MKTTELQNRINDAADGLLSKHELQLLENELNSWPGMLEDYRLIMALPDLNKAAGNRDQYLDSSHLQQIFDAIDHTEEHSFQMLSIHWFRRYALAASLIFLAVTAGFNFSSQKSPQISAEISQLIYSDINLYEDDYLHLIDLTLQD